MKPYYLVVNANPNRQGGNGKKYKTEEEAVAAGTRYLATNSHDYPEGVHICAPIKHIQLAAPPVEIKPVA